MEAAILDGRSIRGVAADYKLSRASLARHMQVCSRRNVKAALALRNGNAGASLLDRIAEAGEELIALAKQAKDEKELTVAVNAWQGRLRALELEGRATGEISAGGSVVLQLGVRIDQAQRAVEVVRDADGIAPREVVERALRVCRAWNAACVAESERVTL